MEVIKKISPAVVVTVEMLIQLFEIESLEQLVDAVSERPLTECVQWWLDHLALKKRKQADTPRIIIGTGHSVKGGEADVVYVLPKGLRVHPFTWPTRSTSPVQCGQPANTNSPVTPVASRRR